jgi:hypothetical protein
MVDTLGLILAVVIQGTSVQDRNGALAVIEKMMESRKKIIKNFADGGYNGTLVYYGSFIHHTNSVESFLNCSSRTDCRGTQSWGGASGFVETQILSLRDIKISDSL